MQRLCVGLTGLCLLLSAGCEPALQSASGLRLPDGDVAKGKAAFVSLKCYNCHPVDGVELPAPEKADAPQVVLGGQFYRVKTRGELAVSILDPSFKLAASYKPETVSREGKSLMPDFNHTLSIEQNTIMQACFFSASGVLPREEAIEAIKNSIRKTYAKKGPEIVEMNLKAVDGTLAHLHRVEVPADAERGSGADPGARSQISNLKSEIEKGPSRLEAASQGCPAPQCATETRSPFPKAAPRFVQEVVGPILAGRGDDCR